MTAQEPTAHFDMSQDERKRSHPMSVAFLSLRTDFSRAKLAVKRQTNSFMPCCQFRGHEDKILTAI